MTAAINPLARKFSIATIIFAPIHRVLEWLDALRFEQHFLGRLPDIVADALLPWVGFLVLRDPRATGILCGARGFTLCCMIEPLPGAREFLAGNTDSVTTGTMYEPGSAMLISVIGFGLALKMCPSTNGEGK